MDSATTIISFILLTFLPCHISSQLCQKTCGKQSLKYPFGSTPGCGDPRFQNYITCNHHEKHLTLTTHTGTYPITTIDYTTQVISISDPTMSTCSCSHPSQGFGLDWDAPFTFHEQNIFALLDCSITSSPIYKSSISEKTENTSSSTIPLCDNQGAPYCSLLYSCRAISALNLPISTCCIYTPVDLGPTFELDLKKLQCSSYSGFYGFNNDETSPERWNYGVTLKYKFNVNNEYPSLCSDCERSDGVCGYTTGGVYNTFICNCPSGINTTTDCFYGASWSGDSTRLTGTWLINSLAWFLVWALP